MKLFSFTSILTILLLSNCSKKETVSSGSLNNKWVVESIHNLQTGEILFDSLLLLSSVRSRSIVLEFQDDGRNGKISGTIGPNTAAGGYKLGVRNQIETSTLGGSKVGDNSRFNNKFRTDFPNVNRFEFGENGNLLILWYDNDRQQMKLFKL